MEADRAHTHGEHKPAARRPKPSNKAGRGAITIVVAVAPGHPAECLALPPANLLEGRVKLKLARRATPHRTKYGEVGIEVVWRFATSEVLDCVLVFRHRSPRLAAAAAQQSEHGEGLARFRELSSSCSLLSSSSARQVFSLIAELEGLAAPDHRHRGSA